MGFWNILRESKIHAIFKTWEKRISVVQEKYGKTQIFLTYGFITYFSWNRNPRIFENLEKWIFTIRETHEKAQKF